MVSQPALHLAECPEDDDVEGGEDDDGAELGGDERVDAVEGGVVPARSVRVRDINGERSRLSYQTKVGSRLWEETLN